MKAYIVGGDIAKNGISSCETPDQDLKEKLLEY
jgi:hypothetical protein